MVPAVSFDREPSDRPVRGTASSTRRSPIYARSRPDYLRGSMPRLNNDRLPAAQPSVFAADDPNRACSSRCVHGLMDLRMISRVMPSRAVAGTLGPVMLELALGADGMQRQPGSRSAVV